jgi:uncharacterized membrane protein YgcG
MSDLENVPSRGRHPQDPAGTQPRYDPDGLLPSDPVPDDVVDADVVDEREAERGDLLPARRGVGGAPAIAPARHSQYAPRFHFLTGALVAVGLAALAGLVAFVVAPKGGSSDDGVNWSAWRPTDAGTSGAQQIADHVGSEYKLPDGRQIVNVGVTGLEIQGVPLAVAVRQNPAQGGNIKVFDDSGIIFHLCGLGPSCAISTGKASKQRGLLLRREALELALYSFRYLGDVHQVVVFMPPAKKGQAPSQALFFREGDVAQELDRPLTASLSPRVPSVSNVKLSPDAPLVDQITAAKTFNFSLTGDQTSQRGFIVLDPPTDPPANGSAPSSASGSSASGSSSSGSGSGSGSSGGSSGSSTGTTTGSTTGG